jgi:FkbM family methyltransferase
MTAKLNRLLELIKHFENPCLILLARSGMLKMAHISYGIRKDGVNYRMIGRSTSEAGGDLWVLREVLTEESYQDILDLLPAGPLRVVDIGANIGAFTVWLHKRHGLKEAFCFEPDPDNFSLCQFNLSQNGCENATAIREAVGGTTRKSEFWINAARPANSSFNKREGVSATYAQKVHIVALREWLQKFAGTFDVLKMDCEGSEWEIMDAAPEAFQRFSTIVVEVHRDPAGKHEPGDFAACMARQGFTQKRWDDRTPGLYIGHR